MPQGRCPVCRYQIHVLEEGTAAVIKAVVIKADLRSKRTIAKCPKCKAWLVVPLQYHPGRTNRPEEDRFSAGARTTRRRKEGRSRGGRISPRQNLVLMVCLFVVVGMGVRLGLMVMIVRMLSLFLIMLMVFVLTVRVVVLQPAVLMGIFFHGTLLMVSVRDRFMQPAFLS